MLVCFVFFRLMCCYRCTYPAPNTQISWWNTLDFTKTNARIGKWRRNVYSQLSDTQTIPSPSMTLLQLRLLCIDGPGPKSDIGTDLQKVIPGNSKLQRTQLMGKVFNFFLNHPIKITCICSLPSVHQELGHFSPSYFKTI